MFKWFWTLFSLGSPDWLANLLSNCYQLRQLNVAFHTKQDFSSILKFPALYFSDGRLFFRKYICIFNSTLKWCLSLFLDRLTTRSMAITQGRLPFFLKGRKIEANSVMYKVNAFVNPLLKKCKWPMMGRRTLPETAVYLRFFIKLFHQQIKSICSFFIVL